MALIFHRVLLIACFATWFGGFGFYVSIVVPIGTDVLGSALEQGLITRRVTYWLNVFGGLALASMLVESIVTWRTSKNSMKLWSLGLCIFMIVAQVALFVLHPMLDAMIDVEAKAVSESAKFYQLHRVYLWASTFQWIAAWGWLVLLVVGLERRK